tara:strand:- start:1357 stop:1581 length:225 start_codon:yes stop_codon:yes gene_type:complete
MSKSVVKELKAKIEELELRVRAADNLNEDLEEENAMEKYFSGMFYKAIDWDKVDSLTKEQMENHLKKLKGDENE